MGGDGNTAKIANDKIPINYEKIKIMDDDASSPLKINDNSTRFYEASSLKLDYENSGLDTSTLDTPYTGPTTQSKGKLKLNCHILNNDESIEHFPRAKKKPHKDVKYKEALIPEEFNNITPEPRRSDRLEKTIWAGTRKVMTVIERRPIPSSIHAIPSGGLNEIPMKQRIPIPLCLVRKSEKMRVLPCKIRFNGSYYQSRAI